MAENTADVTSAPLGRHYAVSGGQMLLHRSGSGELTPEEYRERRPRSALIPPRSAVGRLRAVGGETRAGSPGFRAQVRKATHARG